MQYRNKRHWVRTAAAAAALCMACAVPAGAAPEKGFQIIRHYLSDYVYDEESGTGKNYGGGSYQEILPEDLSGDYSQLTETLKQYNQKEMSEMENTFQEYTKDAREALQNGGFEYEAHLETRMLPRRFDDTVFSFLRYCETYTGGAHGYYYYSGYNYDPATGGTISIQQVCPDLDALKSAIVSELETKYEGSYFLEEGVDLSNYETGDDPYHFNWVLDPTGLLVIFNPYEIASYAEGIQTVYLEFSQHPELFDPAYVSGASGYAYQLMPFLSEQVDMNGDGTMETISLQMESDEYNDMKTVTVNVDDSSASEDVHGSSAVPVLMHTDDGRNYLYLEYMSDNDYREVLVFDLSVGAVRKVGGISGGFGSIWQEDINGFTSMLPADPRQFTLVDHINLLSSYAGMRDYTLSEDGMAQPLEDFYDVPNGQTLKTVRDLPAMLLPDGEAGADVAGEQISIPAGTSLTICRSDAGHYVDLQREDGSFVRVTVDPSDSGWPIMIDGENADTYFEKTYYAG